jgi:HAD superfamily hydrolase (TIGR01509 family)
MIQAAIFDIDGTLIDSNDLHAEAWRQTFLRFGVDLPHAAIRAQVGKGGDNLMPALLPSELLAAHGEEIEEQRGALFKREYLPRVRPFPGVRALFEQLRQRGTRIVLASSAKEEEVAHHTRLLDIGDLLDAAVSADDAEHSKPCPDIFAAALDLLGDNAAVVVGDTPYDMIAARRIDMPAVGVRSGGFDDVVLRDAGAAALFDGPWALPRAVTDWLPSGD